MRFGRLVRLGFATALATAATCAIGAPAASAGLLSCGAAEQPFTQFNDSGSYFLVQNGDFEAGTAGWTLTGGARVAPGNDPYHVSGDGGFSLSMPAGSSALSPRTCIALLTPHARMMVDADPGAPRLNVQVIMYGLLGNVLGVLNYSSMDSSDYHDWWASQYVSSKLALPIFTSYCRIKITVASGSGGWHVDDVYEDPWLSGMI